MILIPRLVPWSPLRLLLLVAPVSLAAMLFFGVRHGLRPGPGALSPDSRSFIFPLYFCFGLLMAQRPIAPRYRRIPMLATPLAIGRWIGVFDHPDHMGEVASGLLMNLGLIALIPMFVATRVRFAPFNIVGRDSLFFYLWHPMAIGMMLALEYEGGAALLIATPLFYAGCWLCSLLPVTRLLMGGYRDGGCIPSPWNRPIRRAETRHRPPAACAR